MTFYLAVALVAWPILTLALATRLAPLRRGPSFSTVAGIAAVGALVWPLALLVLFLAPRPQGRR